MYNRYVPDQNGHYRCTVVETDAARVAASPAAQMHLPSDVAAGLPARKNPVLSLLPSSLDSGDLLVLLILLLILMDSAEDDRLSILITIAAFLLL